METAPLIYGKYQLLTRLAQGGLGEVWKARSHGVEGFEKILVVKRIRPDLSDDREFVSVFIEEAKTAVVLTHANIAQVFDLGLADGTYFMAMEYVRGPDLGAALDWCARHGAFVPEELALYVVSELAKGLDYAHRRRDAEMRPLGLVHRDVSPENVLLSYEGEVKLTGFGMARARESVTTRIDLPPDTYAYLAPEQVRGEPLDGRTDVHALGVVLYEMLSHVRVREREGLSDTYARAARGERLPLFGLEGVSPALRAIVERATEPRREDRQANAGDLYEQLIELLYESGRRVGALDLASWLEALAAEAGQGSASEALGPFSGLEELFTDSSGTAATGLSESGEVQAGTALHDDSLLPLPGGMGVGPLEGDGDDDIAIEIDRDERGRDTLPDLLPASFTPRSEWRDVSVLDVDGVSAAELANFVTRYGGELLEVRTERTPDQSAAGESERAPLLVFGMGEADGRDAYAAARAAFRLSHAYPERTLRIALHSGRILLDGEGKPGHAATNEALAREASRWLKRAQPSEVMASPSAAKLLRTRFDVGPAQAGGAAVVTRERLPQEGLGKFVGRREALRVIGDVFAHANRAELRVLGVAGEAGSGKSRLILEIERRLRKAGHDVGIYVAACSPEGRAIPFFAFQELLRAVLGLEDLESPSHVAEQVERLRLLGLSNEQRDAIARVVGVNTQAAVSTAKLETALVRIAYKLAQDRLTVFVWDGAECMDAPTRELVMELVTAPVSARVLVVFLSRTASSGPWTSLPNYQQVVLSPLADEEVARLVRYRLGASEVDGDLVREVNLKTGGNPLFVEELLAAMREHGSVILEQGRARLSEGGAAVELPRTLRGLVASRVGKLSGPHRLILQLAVTFGSRFSPALLARAAELDIAVVRKGLAHLEDRDIVCALGQDEYACAHDLVGEVLYGAIPLAERPALHLAVARAIESLLPAELEAAVERLAFHYREAGDAERAIHFLTRAAERYEGEHALDAAIDAYTQVIELLMHAEQPDRARVLELHARIGELAFATGASEAVADRMGAAIELAERWAAEAHVARFAMLRGRLLNKASRFREGRLWLERAQTVARKLSDRALEREIALAAAEAHARNGEYKAVVQYVQDALEASRESGDVATELRGLLLLAPAYAGIGEIVLARAALSRLETLAGDHAERPVEVELAHIRARLLEAEGDLPAACDAARRALDLAKEYGLSQEVALNAHQLGGLHLRADEEKRAFAALRLSYEVASEHGFTRLQQRNVCLLGFLDALRFDSEQGYARMQQALQYAQERGYVLDVIEEKYLLAMVEQKRGASERARALLREVIELADSHGHVRMCEDSERALRALEQGESIRLPG